MTTGGRQADWHAALAFLKAGQYEQAAAILHEAQVASEQMEDSVLTQLLAVACRICLACSQCRDELEWHRHAFEAADQREQELKQQLYTIFDLVHKHGEPHGAPLAKMTPTDGSSLRPEERVGMWQRIQSLFVRRATPRVSEKEGIDGSAELLASPDYVAPPAGLTTDEKKTSSLSTIVRARSEEQPPPSLVVYCLGPFRVFQDDQPVEEWPSGKGKAVFKYLITHGERPIAKEVLMELFWPGAQPDAARNNLNVAIYGLRQALRKDLPFFSHVLYQDDCYLLNSKLNIWLDYEAFTGHFSAAQALERRGDLASAIREYRAAEVLYEGEFLEEDRYEDWLMPQRQRLREDYLALLDRLSRYYCDQDNDACVSLCRKMLTVDPCREEAHRRLMRCYSRQGQPYLALRQYHLCVEILKEELDMPPMDKTLVLYRRIRAGETV